MKGLRYVIVGSIAGLAASTVSARASAMCWQRQPGCATSIATDIADRITSAVFNEQQQGHTYSGIHYEVLCRALEFDRQVRRTAVCHAGRRVRSGSGDGERYIDSLNTTVREADPERCMTASGGEAGHIRSQRERSGSTSRDRTVGWSD